MNPFPNINPIILYIIIVWSLFWRGIALWHAAKCGQRNWFIVLLLVNSVGILDLAYLYFFAKKKFDIRTLKP